MAEAAELERRAGAQNSAGHYESFAALDSKVHADPQEARRRHTEAARHYFQAADGYVEAARAHLNSTESGDSEARARERQRAAADYGLAASDYWYAGRAYADAYDFEHAAEQMAAAAATYVAEAKLHEEDGELETASTLRTIARFRYLDAQRYFLQASQLHQRLAAAFEASGARQASAEERRQAAEWDRHARTAAADADREGPKHHAAYQPAYQASPS